MFVSTSWVRIFDPETNDRNSLTFKSVSHRTRWRYLNVQHKISISFSCFLFHVLEEGQISKTLFWGREPTSTSRVRKPAPVECQERTQGWPSCDYFNLAKQISGHIVWRKQRCFLFRGQGWESCPSRMPRATAVNLQGRKGGSAAGPHVMSSTKIWKHSKSTCTPTQISYTSWTPRATAFKVEGDKKVLLAFMVKVMYQLLVSPGVQGCLKIHKSAIDVTLLPICVVFWKPGHLTRNKACTLPLGI